MAATEESQRGKTGKAKTVLITGAAGNLGTRLREHLKGRYDLRLLDIDPRGTKTLRRPTSAYGITNGSAGFAVLMLSCPWQLIRLITSPGNP